MPDAYSFRAQESVSPPRTQKRIGGYLVEAGLLTPAQVDVALNDQKMTGMRFGEILAARGWVKQQTVEYLMQKVILPEQKAIKQEAIGDRREVMHTQPPQKRGRSNIVEADSFPVRKSLVAKPLPSIAPPEDEVGWVG